ncbi:MAG: OmpA family protein [Candidatus Competibacteraceae bacterium]|nr:OmpA family protein [Candidatus Competibacteraceae bacterium]
MKKPILIILGTALFYPVFSQKFVEYRNDFSDSKNSLYGITSIDKFNTQIVDGNYVFDYSGTTWRYQSSGYAFSKELDFSYEVTISKTTGIDSKHYGMVFLVEDVDNHSKFIISNDGSFEIHSLSANTQIVSKKGKTKSVVKGGANRLRIETKSGTFHFFVNDEKVATLTGIPYHSNYFGIFSEGPNKMFVDEVVFRQDGFPPLKTVSGIPSTLNKENLGPNINTSYSEISPIISQDGKYLFYSSKNNPDNIGGKDDKDDVWISERQSDNTWSMRKNIGKPINNSSPNTVISITPDNNSMLLRGRYKSDGSFGGNGASITYRTQSGWSMPVPIDIENYKNNASTSEYWLSSDGMYMLLTIQHPDKNYGDKDVYVCKRKEDGSFGPPINLGPVINTWLSELSPFLAADGVSLYFSSYGHAGYGSADIFVSRRLDDTWQNWSEPENLGPGINGPEWNAYYVIPASGEYAYMAASGEYGGSDIFRIQLPQALKPKPVVLIAGKVLNSKTKEPLEAIITYRNLKTDEVLGSARSSPIDGSYKIILPSGNMYSFLAEKDLFIATSENFNTLTLTEYTEINRDLLLTPIEVGQTIRLNNVFFDSGKFDLREESYSELNRVVTLLNKNPNISIEVSGHTDAVGNDATNQTLSQNRANSVCAYITGKGIDKSRLTCKGYGETKAVASNSTEEGKQLNRRVEFTILKK